MLKRYHAHSVRVPGSIPRRPLHFTLVMRKKKNTRIKKWKYLDCHECVTLSTLTKKNFPRLDPYKLVQMQPISLPTNTIFFIDYDYGYGLGSISVEELLRFLKTHIQEILDSRKNTVSEILEDLRVIRKKLGMEIDSIKWSTPFECSCSNRNNHLVVNI